MLSRQTTPQANLYSYDELNRIIGDQIDAADTIQYQYDLNHNRQQKSQLINLTDDYDYLFGSNQINHQSQSSSDTLTTASLDQQFIYNNANRLYQLIENGQLKAQYLYNANGERTRKTIFNPDATQTITLYHYDLMGYLISETSDTGAPQRDYIWADNMTPVAQIDINGATDTLSYLHTDHLMTPRLATDASQQITWRWEGEAFGETKPVIETTTVNLRFPGQYADAESGLYYNMFRSYDPTVGRYMTSDPIGLLGGLNTYGYVGGNTVKQIDPTGLCGFPCAVAWSITAIFTANEVKQCSDRVANGVDDFNRAIDGGKEAQQKQDAIECIFDASCSARQAEIYEDAAQRGVEKNIRNANSAILNFSSSIPNMSTTGPAPTSRVDVVSGAIINAVTSSNND